MAILKKYHGEIPFHGHLKRYFSLNKKYGSNDRKQISSLCYNYFRLGQAAIGLEISERILTATFLAEKKSSRLLQFFKPEWDKFIDKTLHEKLLLLNSPVLIEDIFPFKTELSEGAYAEKFNQSFLIQPRLFLRIRPGNKNKVIGKISGAGIPYELMSDTCLSLPNSSKINELLELDNEVVVQDHNSQKVGEFIRPLLANEGSLISVWDCCAASGGKSLMAYDINSNIQLTVSDKRSSILENLKRRFQKAGIKNYRSYVADLGNSKFNTQDSQYDLIMADVPCTGSGTWSRTPEQLFYFSKKQIEEYSILQKKIVANVVENLKPGAGFLYITCSVFKKENEEVVNFAIENFGLRLERMELLKGYETQADTMFAAMLIAPAL